jgi:hypothetical protein
MNDLTQSFEERLQEIETYLDLLTSLEQQVQQGLPQFGAHGQIITPQQQRILYSSVYLQLYNLVESTISRCIDTISNIIVVLGMRPDDLSVELRKQWVRFVSRTHTDLNYEKRLEYTIILCEHLIQGLPIAEFMVEKGGGGNWDDEQIYELSKRLGFQLELSAEAKRAVKQKLKNNMGTLALIKDYRNKLSHGNISFAECGENTTVADLRQITARVTLYMREVLDCFNLFIDNLAEFECQNEDLEE